MTSKTSFFNKGIYKSTVKRYAWGSILYFLILFVSTSLALLLNIDNYHDSYYLSYESYPLLSTRGYMVVPVLLAVVVPTIAALLIFRFIHSKKQAIFIHSLPVSRKANYISSILAGFTLMLVPIIVNGGILMLLSATHYANYFTAADCLLWIGCNALIIFMMFSCAVFSASLTGNSFAMIAINILIHSFLFIIATSLDVMADVFIYGFSDSMRLYEIISENNFVYVAFELIPRAFRDNLAISKIAIYAVASAALYIVSYFLCKKRRPETATDVAAYKCLNPIFRYLVTFMATMVGFAIFSTYIGISTTVFAIIVLIISLVAYAASEMVLKKTFNVLYSWKGYVGFALIFLALIGFVSSTSFFGYETRVPETDEIEEAAIYNYYSYVEPFSADEEIITMITNTHKGFVQDGEIPKINNVWVRNYSQSYRRIHIRYNLKNGKTLSRAYYMAEEEFVKMLSKFYENDTYKKQSEYILFGDTDISRVLFAHNEREIREKDEILAALRQDVLSLSYEDLYPTYSDNAAHNIVCSINIEFTLDDTADESDRTESYFSREYLEITDKFENTLRFLEDNEYMSAE